MTMKMIPHRLSLSLDSELEGISEELVMEKILERVEVIRKPV